MASWQYAFLFPGAGSKLAPANAIEVFEAHGFSFDRRIRPAVIIDKDGHLEHGDEVPVYESRELERRLRNEEQFQVECRSDELYFSISFATLYSNPYLMIGWARKLFREMQESEQHKCWRLLRQVARKCNASYVVVVDDPPDYFEDRFLEINGQRFLENRMPSGKRYEIREVWTDTQRLMRVPGGVDEAHPVDIGDGFVSYCATD